ncbi:cold-shock protein [Chloroflexota bacterium]
MYLKGKISRLIRDRGFGFIAVEGGKDVFFHSSSLAEGDFDSLVEGADVEFDSESGPKGPSAVNVRVEGPTESKKEED